MSQKGQHSKPSGTGAARPLSWRISWRPASWSWWPRAGWRPLRRARLCATSWRSVLDEDGGGMPTTIAVPATTTVPRSRASFRSAPGPGSTGVASDAPCHYRLVPRAGSGRTRAHPDARSTRPVVGQRHDAHLHPDRSLSTLVQRGSDGALPAWPTPDTVSFSTAGRARSAEPAAPGRAGLPSGQLYPSARPAGIGQRTNRRHGGQPRRAARHVLVAVLEHPVVPVLALGAGQDNVVCRRSDAVRVRLRPDR